MLVKFSCWSASTNCCLTAAQYEAHMHSSTEKQIKLRNNDKYPMKEEFATGPIIATTNVHVINTSHCLSLYKTCSQASCKICRAFGENAISEHTTQKCF